MIDKKAAAKEKKEARKTSTALEGKAQWLAEKAVAKGRRFAKGVTSL